MPTSNPSCPRDGPKTDGQVLDKDASSASGATQRHPALTENLVALATKALAEGSVTELPGPLDCSTPGGRGDGSTDGLGWAGRAGDLLLRAASRGHEPGHRPHPHAPRCPGHETAEGELDFSLSTSAAGEAFLVNGDYSESCPICMVCKAVLRRLMESADLGRPGPAARTFAHLARNKLELTYDSGTGASSLFLDVYKLPGRSAARYGALPLWLNRVCSQASRVHCRSVSIATLPRMRMRSSVGISLDAASAFAETSIWGASCVILQQSPCLQE